MTISYNWLSDYLPETIEPEKLSKILTSIGLEVESLEKYESIKGGLAGLVIGEVLECERHPNADKLKLTKVNVGAEVPLQIVCGANNVAAGQKVIVARVGTTIYPVTGEPMTMRVATIRSVQSEGMICAEDEIGLGLDHAGIIVLPGDAVVGSPATAYFQPYSDWIYEIGLTPNRMDAMSHMGVARDVCAYLTHHQKEAKPKSPFSNTFKPDNMGLAIKVRIENEEACQRYTGVTITGVTVMESPKWLQNRLTAIGQRPINNIVDITNFILHETGQPLHAFDADAITGNEIIVKNLPEGTKFISLDEKERKLSKEDLVICNAKQGMCIAGVFGGLNSGVKPATKNIFLESAWFNPVDIRKTSVRHGLRTDAATRFEKGVDISNTLNVLKRATLMIKEIAGGEIASDVVDVYPNPKPKTEVTLKNHYLKKLSGKNYHSDKIKRILTSLGFEIVREGQDELRIAVPYSKPDITIPADIVEEILRIDGLDNIEIPSTITISPAVEQLGFKEGLKDKIAGWLVGQGFMEIFTNSITNSKYFDEVHMLSASAFNAFLKTLEEPPSYAIFILATTEKHKILPTILSRCQIFDFKRITNNDTVTHLQEIVDKEELKAEKAALQVIAQKSEGCMRDSLSILDKIVSFTNGAVTYQNTLEHLNILDEDYYFRMLDSMQQQDMAAAILLFDEINRKGFEGDLVLNGFAEFIV